MAHLVPPNLLQAMTKTGSIGSQSLQGLHGMIGTGGVVRVMGGIILPVIGGGSTPIGMMLMVVGGGRTGGGRMVSDNKTGATPGMMMVLIMGGGRT